MGFWGRLPEFLGPFLGFFGPPLVAAAPGVDGPLTEPGVLATPQCGGLGSPPRALEAPLLCCASIRETSKRCVPFMEMSDVALCRAQMTHILHLWAFFFVHSSQGALCRALHS